jgi:hypothetical protein
MLKRYSWSRENLSVLSILLESLDQILSVEETLGHLDEHISWTRPLYTHDHSTYFNRWSILIVRSSRLSFDIEHPWRDRKKRSWHPIASINHHQAQIVRLVTRFLEGYRYECALGMWCDSRDKLDLTHSNRTATPYFPKLHELVPNYPPYLGCPLSRWASHWIVAQRYRV